VAGISVDLLFFPVDTLKTRLQSSQGFANAGGFKGMYKGIGSVALGSAPGGQSISSSLVEMLHSYILMQIQRPLFSLHMIHSRRISK